MQFVLLPEVIAKIQKYSAPKFPAGGLQDKSKSKKSLFGGFKKRFRLLQLPHQYLIYQKSDP